MTKAEQFCKLNGIEWYEDKTTKEKCKCGEVTFLSNPADRNPTFTDAKSILEVMMKMIKRKDCIDFIEKRVGTRIGLIPYIHLHFILNPDKLLDEAIKFCEEHKK